MYTTDVEKLKEELKGKVINPRTLVSKQPSAKTVEVFEYLQELYRHKTVFGQQYFHKAELEDRVYFDCTGKLPAMRGYDMMDVDPKHNWGQIDRAIEWAKKSGCIITICWHWYAPDNMEDMENCPWSFYTKEAKADHSTSFDLFRAVEPGTAEYEFTVASIDKAAEQLKRFEAEDIPVLWRPLHEAYGNWFWWGNKGNDNGASVEAYKKLWYVIFDRLENYHKLTNLIWVWNGQNKCMAIDPNTYDICGEDIYSQLPHDHSSQKEKFEEIVSYSHGKMVTLSECGFIPDPDQMEADKVTWLWWLPWWGSFVYKMDENWKTVLDQDGNPIISDKYMSKEFLCRIMNDDRVVTLDKLPWVTPENLEYAEKTVNNHEK